jgi:large subunit ribosomal protein L25
LVFGRIGWTALVLLTSSAAKMVLLSATRKAKCVMSSAGKLVVEPRTETGSAACRRLRKRGLVPGNVYGHKSPPVAVVVSEDVLAPILKSGSKVVDLEVSGTQDKAVIREVKWDVFGRYVEHFDLLRVDPNERVNVTVPIIIKGTAPGVLGGGMIEQPIHSIVIDCLAYQIPDSIIVRVNALELGQAIHVHELSLPEGSHAHAVADAIVVHIVKAREVAEAAPTSGAAEPELVGKKPAEAEAAKDDKKKK